MLRKIMGILTVLLCIACVSTGKDETNTGNPAVPEENGGKPAWAVPGLDSSVPSLAAEYADYFEIGTCVELNQLQGEEGKMVIKHYSSLTAENVMKPHSMAPQEGKFSFSGPDRMVEFAQAHNKLVRGHTLVWHQQDAKWMYYDDAGNTVSKNVLLERLENHITTIVSRYKGKVYAWDVVNEVYARTGFRQSEWYKICGEEYIEKSFRYARKADPEAKLFINEIEAIEPHKRDNMYNHVKSMLDKGVPIDGIGLQFHITMEYPGLRTIRDALEKFNSLGVEIHITEFDMSLNGDPNLVADNAPESYLVRQAHRYKEIFDMFKEYDSITNVTCWGFQDGHTWLTYSPVDKPDWPLLFDKDLDTKLAFWALVDPARLPADVVIERKDNNKFIALAHKGTASIDGVEENVWAAAEEIPIKIYIEGNGAYGAGKALWDNENLYLLVKVTDENLSKMSSNPYEHDSVEIFVDELNNKSIDYLEDDAQYRLNFENEFSTGGNPAEIVSATAITETGYNVEVRIPFRFIEPAPGIELGFDLQINDDPGTGVRNSYSKWNDKTNESYRNTSGFGTLVLGE